MSTLPKMPYQNRTQRTREYGTRDIGYHCEESMNEEIQELIDLYTPLDGSDEYLRELYRKLSEVRVIR